MSQLETQLFNLKFAAKQLQRNSKKSSKEEKDEKAKLKKAISQGNVEGAKIYAQNAIRKKNEALNYLRLASRVDGVASRVQTAVSMRKVTTSMSGVVKGLDQAMASMNLEKVSQIMDKFEQQFEDIDVQTQYMENSMGNSVVNSTPQDEVETLMQQVADENGLELHFDMAKIPQGGKAAVKEQEAAGDELEERLAKLRNP